MYRPISQRSRRRAWAAVAISLLAAATSTRSSVAAPTTTVERFGPGSFALAPAARAGCVAAYDGARRQVVLFGGAGSGNLFGDTWVWNDSAWTQKHPAHSPPARIDASMVYDGALGKVILFGGNVATGATNDLWG